MQVAIALYPGVTALDWVGPYQVLTNRPGTEVVLCAAEPGPVVDDNGLMTVTVEATFADVPAPDVEVVPGGFVTGALAARGHPLVAWARATHATSTWTTSVCTGALVLGAAGILDGLPATTHWTAYDELASYGAHPTPQRVVESGRVITAAGVSAGIDMALALVGRIDGPDMAMAIQLGIEYDPQPPFAAGAPAKAPAAIRDLVVAVTAARSAPAAPPGAP